jgi:hypothetical protein
LEEKRERKTAHAKSLRARYDDGVCLYKTLMLPPWAMESFDGTDEGHKGHFSFTLPEAKKPTLMKLYA